MLILLFRFSFSERTPYAPLIYIYNNTCNHPFPEGYGHRKSMVRAVPLNGKSCQNIPISWEEILNINVQRGFLIFSAEKLPQIPSLFPLKFSLLP